MSGRFILYFIPIMSNIIFNVQEWALSPLLIYIVESDTSGYANKNNMDYWISVIFVAASAFSFLGFYIQGWIATRFGYKSSFCLVYFFNLLGNIIQYIKYDNILYICIGQVLYGMSNSSLISQTWLNFISDDTDAVQMQVFFENSYSIGCIMGVLVAGLANEYIGMNSWGVINLFIIVCDVVLLTSLMFVYEPFQHREGKIKLTWTKSLRLKDTKPSKQPSDQENSFRDGSSKFKIRNVSSRIICAFVIGICSAIYNSYLSIKLETDYHFSVLQVCFVYAALAVLSLILSTIFVQRITDRLNEHHTLLISFIALTIVYVTFGVCLEFVSMQSAFTIIGFFTAIEVILQFSEVSNGVTIQKRTPEKLRARILMLSITAHEIGYVLGGLVVLQLPNSSLFYVLAGLALASSFIVRFSNKIDNDGT